MFSFSHGGTRTESGYMYEESGDIVFEEGVLNFIKNLYLFYWSEGDALHKILLGGLFLSLALALFSIFLVSALNPTFYLIMIVAFPAGLSAVVIFRQFFTTFTNVRRVPKENIRYVQFNDGRKFLTKPKVVFMYHEGRDEKKRSVNLPSLVAPRSKEMVQEAKDFLEENNLKLK